MYIIENILHTHNDKQKQYELLANENIFSHAYLYLCVSSDTVDLSFKNSIRTILIKSTKFICYEKREFRQFRPN